MEHTIDCAWKLPPKLADCINSVEEVFSPLKTNFYQGLVALKRVYIQMNLLVLWWLTSLIPQHTMTTCGSRSPSLLPPFGSSQSSAPARCFAIGCGITGEHTLLICYGSMDHVQLYVHNTLPANRHLGKDLCEVSSHLSTVASNVANSKYSLISKRQIKALAGIMHSLYSRYRTRSWY